MNRFTWAELADMHLVFGEARCNALEAQRLYAERFPRREVPDRRRFVDIDRRLITVSFLASY